MQMFAFVNGPEYHLPFQTFSVCRFQRDHMHRDVSGCTWTEQMQLSIRLPALIVSTLRAANNDNQRPQT